MEIDKKNMLPPTVGLSKYVLSWLLALMFLFGCSADGNDDTPSSKKDSQPPSAPLNLVAENTGTNTTTLNWTESTDNIGVWTYLIFKNNENFTANSSAERTINGLKPNTEYTFKVQAKDKAGNLSNFSNVATVTTLKAEALLQQAKGDLNYYVDQLIDQAPGDSGNDYTPPTASQLNIWNSVIDAILSENMELAVEKSGQINYQITEFTDNTLSPAQVFYILEEKSEKSYYWGTYIFSKNPKKENLILMAPHIKNDINTGNQAVFCFKNNLAKAVFISGTHRCNHSERSSCSGTTATCNAGSEPYRISDMAHNVNTIFQKTTENLFKNIPNSVFIQLHGFGKKSSDPYVIMSNGTREVPEIDYATKIKNALLEEDNTLTFKLAHIDKDWTRLIGFTNTQGRLINKSANPCSRSATETTGRFIHIEQERTKMRKSAAEWKKMSNALGKVF